MSSLLNINIRMLQGAVFIPLQKPVPRDFYQHNYQVYLVELFSDRMV